MTATNFTAGEAVSHVYPAQATVFNRGSNYLSSLSITMNTKNTEETAGGGQEHEYNSRNLGDDVDADDGSRHLRERDNGGQEHEYESGHPDNMDVDDDGGYLHERDNGDPSDSVYQQRHREPVQAERGRYVQQGISREPRQDHPSQTPSKESSKQMSSSENEVPTGSSARHSLQGQSRSQHEAATKQRDSNRENSGRGQIIYVNERPYTEKQLRLHEQFWTLIENDYVDKDQFDKLDHDYQMLDHDYQTLGRLYKQEKELLCSLQEDVLSRVDRYQPKSDAEIQNEFNDVKLAVISFSKSLVSGVAPEVLRHCLDGLALSEDMDDEVWRLNKRWNSKLLVESVIWKELYRGLLKDPFRVYERSNDYINIWRKLFKEGTDRDLYPIPSEMSEQWRVITAKSLDALCHKNLNMSDDAAIWTKHYLEQMLKRIGHHPEQHEDELNYIIASAQKLAKTLSTQKARLRLFVPAIGERYSTKKVYNYKLEPANRHGDELESGNVLFVVVPGLRKWGDGNGHSLETCKDGIAAKVLISG